MNKRNVLIGLVVLVVVIAGGYAIFHKSPKTTTTDNQTNNTTNNQPQNPSNNGDIVQTKTSSSVGQYLADANGNALYTYGADKSGVSNCSGSCLYNWPAYAATSTSATLPTNVTVIKRDDGSSQYAYKGLPLYTFTSDSAGQVTGNGVENFHVAKP